MRTPHILLVDDDPLARESLAVLLTAEGYRVTPVGDAEAALEAARRDVPAIVISDVVMPRSDGFDLVKELRAHAQTAHVPILLMSGLSSPERRAQGLDLGADDFVAKPIDVDELLARIRVQLRHAEDREMLERRALLDPLTGVLNRRGVGAELQREVNRARRYGSPLSVLMIDIDRFKALNDGYGHQAGDTVLRQVAATLASSVRSADHVGRYGGDEFLIVLPETDFDAAAVLAGRVRSLRLPPLAVHAADAIEVSVSVGVATLRHEDTVEQLIERADQSMYRVKRTGELPRVEPP